MHVLSKYCQYFSSLILLCNYLFVCNRNSLFAWLKWEYLSSGSSFPLLTTTGCSGQPEHCALHYPWCAQHYACPSCALHSALPPWSTVLCTATPWGVEGQVQIGAPPPPASWVFRRAFLTALCILQYALCSPVLHLVVQCSWPRPSSPSPSWLYSATGP